MDPHLVRYVFRYYSHFMTTNERLANRHFLATAKTTHGRTDLAAQAEARNSALTFGTCFRTILKYWSSRWCGKLFTTDCGANYGGSLWRNRGKSMSELRESSQDARGQTVPLCRFDWHT
jgi:hypothetical protein